MLTARKLPCGHLFHKYSIFSFFLFSAVACMRNIVHAGRGRLWEKQATRSQPWMHHVYFASAQNLSEVGVHMNYDFLRVVMYLLSLNVRWSRCLVTENLNELNVLIWRNAIITFGVCVCFQLLSALMAGAGHLVSNMSDILEHQWGRRPGKKPAAGRGFGRQHRPSRSCSRC